VLRADELVVVHHDDTVSRFRDVRYALDAEGLRIVTAAGDVKSFPRHDILTTYARLTHPRRPYETRRTPVDVLPAGA
jgi:hypothetical protein